MKLMVTIYLLFFNLYFIGTSLAQSNFELNGYLQNMQTVWSAKQTDYLKFQNSVGNRLNFNYLITNELSVKASLRTIFDYGQFVSLIPNYENITAKDNGYFNLTKIITSKTSYILYSNFDRLNIHYAKNNFEIQIGRQRVNLGISMVWTPNDIFNSSSFLNFDYVEKPGSDAIRFQYYTGITSSVQLICKLNRRKKTTAAIVAKFNNWNYDFQILTGIMENDYIAGGAWSGQIYDAGFTGEFTYFRNKENVNNSTGVFVASIGGNYMFSNGLLFQTEFLFNSIGRTGKSMVPQNLFAIDYSAKNLSPSKYSFFEQLSYPITPLIKSSVAAIINPNDKSFFINPTLELSLNENVYLLVAGQFFLGEDFTEWGDYGKLYYLRLKWNF